MTSIHWIILLLLLILLLLAVVRFSFFFPTPQLDMVIVLTQSCRHAMTLRITAMLEFNQNVGWFSRIDITTSFWAREALSEPSSNFARWHGALRWSHPRSLPQSIPEASSVPPLNPLNPQHTFSCPFGTQYRRLLPESKQLKPSHHAFHQGEAQLSSFVRYSWQKRTPMRWDALLQPRQ